MKKDGECRCIRRPGAATREVLLEGAALLSCDSPVIWADWRVTLFLPLNICLIQRLRIVGISS
jgi:hypothetical protein